MPVEAVPGFVTHYHLPDRSPFLNLSDLPPAELAAVAAELGELGRAGRSERRFGSRYMDLRHRTEALLRDKFEARGGQISRRSPHYFVLGESEWFRALYANAGEVRIPLSDLPSKATSLTWSDSVVSMGLLPEFGIETIPKPQYSKVFRLDELDEVVARYGLPQDAPDYFIEVQVWNDDPLRWSTPK